MIIGQSKHRLFPVPSDIIDEESSSDTLAKENMRVLLNCKARGNPKPTISWVREDGKKIKTCRRSYVPTTTTKGQDMEKAKTKVVRRECRDGKIISKN